MSDNRKQWDDWLEAEIARPSYTSPYELFHNGYKFYKQADYDNAAPLFCRAATIANTEGDIDTQCECLLWEGYCYFLMDKLKMALSKLLFAEQLEGGTSSTRFHILSELCNVASQLPLEKNKQLELLKNITAYKSYVQIGSSKSIVLRLESIFYCHIGNKTDALNCAQEAFKCQKKEPPVYDDCYYYRTLLERYCESGLISEAQNILQNWRALGSYRFLKTTSWQLLAEAQIFYLNRQLALSWDSICRCRFEEVCLCTYGKNISTIKWFIRIAIDYEQMNDARSALLLLFRWHNSDSLYDQYDCFYYFTYYYSVLSHCPHNSTNFCGSKYNTPSIAHARAWRCYQRAKRIGQELDRLLETNIKQNELDELQAKF